MKTYKIPDYGINVIIDDAGIGAINSNLKDHLIGDENNPEGSGAVDALEALILAHACAGLDISSPIYVTGLHTCMEALGNNL